MNLAIILSVSKYKIPGNDLPASKNDGEIINSILTTSAKYDHILYIKDNQSSIEVKDQLDDFFTKYRGQEINEFFFYYSGHGDFSNDKFYYLLSDYDEKKKNQTTIQNEYFDDLIRSLEPELVVKVVDACQSGARYIKDFDILPKYFNESKSGFKNCYFMFSSLSSQYSYQDDNLSFFTKSFIEAIKVHTKEEISFKNIIEYISDEFENIGDQTPFYVIQAQMTEKFCKYNSELRAYLNKLLIEELGLQSEEKKISILDLVTANAKEYVDKKGAIKSMEFCQKEFVKINIDKEINELYDFEVVFSFDHNSLEGSSSISNWLESKPHDFFAKPLITWDGEHVGYDVILEDSPYTSIVIEIISKYPNLKSYKCNISVLISKKEILFFYSILRYLESGWDNKEPDLEDIKWTFIRAKISEDADMRLKIKNIFKDIEKFIRSDIESQFGLDLL